MPSSPSCHLLWRDRFGSRCYLVAELVAVAAHAQSAGRRELLRARAPAAPRGDHVHATSCCSPRWKPKSLPCDGWLSRKAFYRGCEKEEGLGLGLDHPRRVNGIEGCCDFSSWGPRVSRVCQEICQPCPTKSSSLQGGHVKFQVRCHVTSSRQHSVALCTILSLRRTYSTRQCPFSTAEIISLQALFRV